MDGGFSRIKNCSLVFLAFLLSSFSEARVYVEKAVSGSQIPRPLVGGIMLPRWGFSRYGQVRLLEGLGAASEVGDYLACNTSGSIERYSSRRTTVKLERSGPNYFMSGVDGRCMDEQKVAVLVISDNHSGFVGGCYNPATSRGGRS